MDAVFYRLFSTLRIFFGCCFFYDLFIRSSSCFLGFLRQKSPSSLSYIFCTCRFELETSCCIGGSDSSIEVSSVSRSGNLLVSGGSRGKEGSVDGEGFGLEEVSPRISKEFLLGGRLLCGGRAFLEGDFVAGACLVSTSGWEPKGPA
jgi:hypothetical protein